MGFVKCAAHLLQRNATIQKPLHEEQVNEIQEGRIRACGLATTQHRGLMTDGVSVAVAVSGQPAPHPACGKPNQTAGFGRRIGWTVQLNREGRVGHRWRISQMDEGSGMPNGDGTGPQG